MGRPLLSLKDAKALTLKLALSPDGPSSKKTSTSCTTIPIILRATTTMITLRSFHDSTPMPANNTVNSGTKGERIIKTTEAEMIQQFREKEGIIKKELQAEAGFLTKSLYRTCLRSVRLIRPGNDHDEEEFQRRERKQKEDDENPTAAAPGMFSMLPRVDRVDELNSRAEYYHQYARENLVQETDCLLPLLGDKKDVGILEEQDVQRFLFLLKKGDRDRKWLLQDMMFPDPYKESFPKERAKQFEEKSLAYIREREKVKRIIAGLPVWNEEETVDDNDDDDNNHQEDSDDEDDGEKVPSWFREKYPDVAPKK